jgi:hypothetical protein
MASACSSTLLSVSMPPVTGLKTKASPAASAACCIAAACSPGGFSASGRLQITVVTPFSASAGHIAGLQLRGNGIAVGDLLEVHVALSLACRVDVAQRMPHASVASGRALARAGRCGGGRVDRGQGAAGRHLPRTWGDRTIAPARWNDPEEHPMTDLAQRRKELEDRLKALDSRLHEIEEELDSHQSKDWEELATEREGDEVLERLGVSGQEEIAASAPR